ncbi:MULTISPECIES: type III secretion system needle complex protein [Pseudomonas]|uniref:type III secretion system needle complex protein n=1 Tax=Pseudomonas TaxID=286 RepID=UPI000F559E8D|nr:MULTISPECIES: type III secretion system needle complex protein [Pseudomonas]AZF10369.1 MxiH protein [Pseudomonas sp. R2-37-08W]AZF15596.1 MxiH protein [Pseudomonas sp. R3-18-08]AZF20902.1 MxiH protein [Pseudomonas sp. R3-52-08]MDQ0741098.1 type III secretion protein F [Pseudomonas sp. W4I3]MDQ0980381.1 type III secretion protein F [Pseudomonas synxantha]
MANTNSPKPAAPSGWLTEVSQDFDESVTDLKKALDASLDKLKGDASDPSLLADYQARLSEYNLFRNAQSNTVKVFKDIDAAIIQNFR